MKITVNDGNVFTSHSLAKAGYYATLSARGSYIELRENDSGDVIAHQTIGNSATKAVFQLSKIVEEM